MKTPDCWVAVSACAGLLVVLCLACGWVTSRLYRKDMQKYWWVVLFVLVACWPIWILLTLAILRRAC